MEKKTRQPIHIPSAKSEDQPATRRMLTVVRDELVHKMDSGFNRIEARFTALDSKFANIDSKFANIDSRFANIDSRFENMESNFQDLKASYSRMELLLEEQNANNHIVLEGLQALWQRQDRIEINLNHSGI